MHVQLNTYEYVRVHVREHTRVHVHTHTDTQEKTPWLLDVVLTDDITMIFFYFLFGDDYGGLTRL